MQSCRWTVTLNNPTDEEKATFATTGETANSGGIVKYAVVGREVGESGTPHLQCYFHFTGNKRLSAVRGLLGARGHYEIARGSASQNRQYCIKDGDYDEYGQLPSRAGTGGAFDRYEDWVTGLEYSPSEREIARAFPGLFVRYSKRLVDLATHLRPLPVFVPPPSAGEADTGNALSPLREWQYELWQELNMPPDDRKIFFVVDSVGNKGKSWFSRYFFQTYPERTQLLGVGKRDDMAHTLDETKSVFFINVPRGSMEFLQYAVLEMIKDRVIYSPKYNSRTKFTQGNNHVVVMCNEQPSMNALSEDRYEVIDI